MKHNIMISGVNDILSKIALSRDYYTDEVEGLAGIKADLKRLISEADKKWISVKIETPMDVSNEYIESVLALTTLPMRLTISGDEYEEPFFNTEWDSEKWQNTIDSVMTEDYDYEEDYIDANL